MAKRRKRLFDVGDTLLKEGPTTSRDIPVAPIRAVAKSPAVLSRGQELQLAPFLVGRGAGPSIAPMILNAARIVAVGDGRALHGLMARQCKWREGHGGHAPRSLGSGG